MFACGESDSSHALPSTPEPTVAIEIGETGSPDTAPSALAVPESSAESNREALIALYNATDGPNWTNTPTG